MLSDQPTNDTRTAILHSIRAHLAESTRYDSMLERDTSPSILISQNGDGALASQSRVDLFRQQLENVGGRCFVVESEDDAAHALNQIIAELNAGSSPAKRIALSDAPLLSRLARALKDEACEVTIAPNAAELFGYDFGITTAQAAIAETGTLVLESEKERHRLVSLLPPVHIAILRSADICLTMGDALARLRGGATNRMNRAITFITGPSRTADIELTLTVGVHGPKEVFVIIIDDQTSSVDR